MSPAPPPKIEYVITRPIPPSWWKINRHRVLGWSGLAVGLFLGFWLCHTFGAAEPEPAHKPTAPAATHSSSKPHPSPTTSRDKG